jgi:hypothetical protein
MYKVKQKVQGSKSQPLEPSYNPTALSNIQTNTKMQDTKHVENYHPARYGLSITISIVLLKYLNL